MSLIVFLTVYSCREKARDLGLDLEIEDLLATLEGNELADAVEERFEALVAQQGVVDDNNR